MPITAVLVNINSQVVEFIDIFPGNNPPADPQGQMWLVRGVDYPEETVVALGQIWDGTRDVVATTFAEPPPLPLSGTAALEQALDALEQARLAVEQAKQLN